MAIPGLKVVAPAFPADVKGLLAAAVRERDPVLFFEQKSLYAMKGEVPDGEHVDRARQGERACARARTSRSSRWPDGAARARGRRDARRRARHRRDGHRSAFARAARHANDPARGREDRPARHRGRESAAVRMGRRDRVDRRRGAVLGPRRPDRAHHDTAHSACRPPTTSKTSSCQTPTESSRACASSSIRPLSSKRRR